MIMTMYCIYRDIIYYRTICEADIYSKYKNWVNSITIEFVLPNMPLGMSCLHVAYLLHPLYKA